MWIMSFHESGILESKAESERIYMQVVSFSLICILLIAPLFGLISDKQDPRIVVPFAFLLRGFVSACFAFIETPAEIHSFIVCILLILVSLIQFISVEVLFMRDMRKSIRGTMSGLAFFFGSIGTTTFALIGGIMFDKIGPWAPFMLVS